MFSLGAKCGHCGKSGTKIAEISPSGASYKQIAITCSGCSAILGVTDYYNVGTLLKQQEKEIAGLKTQLGNMQSGIQQMDHNIRLILQNMR
jgi:hypothetical protein